MERADLVLLLIDASQALTAEDQALIEATKDKKRIVILNKSDLGQKITTTEMEKLTGSDVISTSILKEQNLDALEELINKLFLLGLKILMIKLW